jgi:hypothetical protein
MLFGELKKILKKEKKIQIRRGSRLLSYFCGTLRPIWLHTMGYSGEFGYALASHCGGFGYMLWATAQNEAV